LRGLEAIRKSSILGSSKNLSILSGLISQAAVHGFKAELESTTEDDLSPFVLRYESVGKDIDQRGYILLYPSDETFMTSSHIGLVVKYVKLADEVGGDVILLFSKDTSARVCNVLNTTGITKHTKIGTFTLQDEKCTITWP
jgi:hypothetical protein